MKKKITGSSISTVIGLFLLAAAAAALQSDDNDDLFSALV
jgi:hypothetical protein